MLWRPPLTASRGVSERNVPPLERDVVLLRELHDLGVVPLQLLDALAKLLVFLLYVREVVVLRVLRPLQVLDLALFFLPTAEKQSQTKSEKLGLYSSNSNNRS